MVDLYRQQQLRESLELFYFAYRAFTAPPDRILEARGLGRVHHRVLHFVGRKPGLTITALLSVLGVSKQALNAPLRQLVALGLVATSPNATDRRAKRLELTPAGVALEAELSGTQVEMLEKVFGAAGADAEQAWLRVMSALAQTE